MSLISPGVEITAPTYSSKVSTVIKKVYPIIKRTTVIDAPVVTPVDPGTGTDPSTNGNAWSFYQYYDIYPSMFSGPDGCFVIIQGNICRINYTSNSVNLEYLVQAQQGSTYSETHYAVSAEIGNFNLPDSSSFSYQDNYNNIPAYENAAYSILGNVAGGILYSIQTSDRANVDVSYDMDYIYDNSGTTPNDANTYIQYFYYSIDRNKIIPLHPYPRLCNSGLCNLGLVTFEGLNTDIFSSLQIINGLDLDDMYINYNTTNKHYVQNSIVIKFGCDINFYNGSNNPSDYGEINSNTGELMSYTASYSSAEFNYKTLIIPMEDLLDPAKESSFANSYELYDINTHYLNEINSDFNTTYVTDPSICGNTEFNLLIDSGVAFNINKQHKFITSLMYDWTNTNNWFCILQSYNSANNTTSTSKIVNFPPTDFKYSTGITGFNLGSFGYEIWRSSYIYGNVLSEITYQKTVSKNALIKLDNIDNTWSTVLSTVYLDVSSVWMNSVNAVIANHPDYYNHSLGKLYNYYYCTRYISTTTTYELYLLLPDAYGQFTIYVVPDIFHSLISTSDSSIFNVDFTKATSLVLPDTIYRADDSSTAELVYKNLVSWRTT